MFISKKNGEIVINFSLEVACAGVKNGNATLFHNLHIKKY